MVSVRSSVSVSRVEAVAVISPLRATSNGNIMNCTLNI